MTLKKVVKMDTSRKIRLYNILSDMNLAWSITELRKKINLNNEEGEKLLMKDLRDLRKNEFITMKEVGNELYAKGTKKLAEEWKK